MLSFLLYLVHAHAHAHVHAHVPTGHLGIVVEVSKLSLPADEGLWVTNGEPQLKTYHRKLRERAVAHSVLGLVS